VQHRVASCPVAAAKVRASHLLQRSRHLLHGAAAGGIAHGDVEVLPGDAAGGAACDSR